MTDTRWFCDRGAFPGEPCAYLDVPHDRLEYASAVIIEEDTGDSDHQAYHAFLGQPHDRTERHPDQISPLFPFLSDAQDWAEARVSVPLSTIPLEIHLEISIEDAYRTQPGEVLIAITEPGQTTITPLGTFAATYHLAAWDLPRTIDHPKY